MAPDSLEFAISDSLVNIALSDKSKAGLARTISGTKLATAYWSL
jgi:hypothetical protein